MNNALRCGLIELTVSDPGGLSSGLDVAGIERVMRDANVKMPALNLLATLVLRVGNNVWGGEQFATKMREMEDSVWEEYSSKVAEVSTTKSGGKR